MTINLANNQTKTEGIQITYAASAISAGGTSSPVKNIGGFNANYAAQIGPTGAETSEIMLVSGTPSGTVLNFGTSPSHAAGTLLYGHGQDTPIYQIHYDQFILFRSTLGTAGPFSALATISIQPDSLFTQYDDTTGSAGYAYYAQYYNSKSGDVSGTSPAFVPGGPTYYSLQKIRQRIKDKLYSANYIKSDDVINDWINECYEDMTNAAIKVNQDYLIGTATYAFGTNGYGTITDNTFIRPIKLEVSYDSGVTFLPSTQIALRDYAETDYFEKVSPRHAWVGETVFEILPHTEAGSARVYYAQRFTPMTSDSDEVTQTLKPYTKAFVEYALGVAYGLDQKDTDYQLHMGAFEAAKKDFVNQITPRDLTGAELIDLVEPVSGLQDDVASTTSDWFW